MDQITTLSGKSISKIGIGSYGIGGKGHRDMPLTEKKEDQVYIDALIHFLNKGANFTEIAVGYGHGQSLALFKQALEKSSVKREDLFITHSLYPRDLPDLDTINQDIKQFHQVMGTEYSDSTLVTQSLLLKYGEETIYKLLNDLLKTEKTRYVSLSNASPTWIKKFKEQFGDKFFAHEGHVSFEIRALQDKGVFKTCNDLNVKNIIWRPLRRNLTSSQNWEVLNELSAKYNKTQNQIVLNWICESGYFPMVMSSSIDHINENLEALDFKMSEEDYIKINDFRPSKLSVDNIDWESIKIDDDIVGLVNGFEKSKQ